MEFLRLEADDYESALRLAREQWGSAVRIHTRRDLKGGRKGKGCEITFYLVDLSKQQRFKTERHLDRLLELNAIDEGLDTIVELRTNCVNLQEAELEMRLIEAILHSIDYHSSFEERYLAVDGEEATDIAIKLALHLKQHGKQVTLLSGGEEPSIISEHAQEHGLAIHAPSETQVLETFDHVISIGAPTDGDGRPTHSFVAVDVQRAVQSVDDLTHHDSLILTNFSTLEKVGPLLSILGSHPAPLAFIAETGQTEQPLHQAGASIFLPKLKGFILDLDALSF
ncbi:MAG: hypothetical protein WC233_05550 [Sphaerochaeta sp.]